MATKAELTEKIIDDFLKTNQLGAVEGKNALKALQKLPSGVNKEKLLRTFRTITSRFLFAYANNVPYEYLPEIQEVVKEWMPKYSDERMRLHSLHTTIQEISSPVDFYKYTELTNFFRYIQSFGLKISNSKKFEAADKYLTDWVLKEGERTLLTVDYAGKDHNTYVLFMYFLAKSNSKECVDVVNFQDRETSKSDRTSKLEAAFLSLEKFKEQSNVRDAYLLVCEKLGKKPKF